MHKLTIIILAATSIYALILAYKANKKAEKALRDLEDNDCILRCHQGSLYQLRRDIEAIADNVSRHEDIIVGRRGINDTEITTDLTKESRD